ncbi:MAG: efflux transporter outer membrane subunit [Proteobacteria bacterium]|nr:efflux transporter outer membrane subunit [Pseudomonadota bacterium]
MKAYTIAIVLLIACISGCTTVGPDYQQPARPELPSQWSAANVEAESLDAANWWKLFQDPVLNSLIDRGARQNLSVEAAGLRIVQARAALGISDALIFPQQQNVSGNLAKVYQNEHSFNSAGIGLDVGWEMDIWGKYARGIESSEANLYASIASYRDVLVTITAEIARNYINYRTAQERTYLSRQNIAIQQRVVAMTQTQFDSGNVTELDVQQSKTQLYATQATLPGLSIARLQARNAIAVLLGVLPAEIAPLLVLEKDKNASTYEQRLILPAAEYDAQSVIPVAPDLDTSVNSALVLRRPDLQVAELQARAQSARIGQAESALYPQFFLFGSIGLSDTVPTDGSFSASNAVTAAIGPGFSWNIFQYGRIKNQVRIEDARFQESLSNYNQSVLQAVQEVSNALIAYQYSVEQSEYNFEGVSASIRAFNISSTQYNNGLVTYQRLLSTVEKMTLREDAYAVTKGNIANQVVALYKALGGGWKPHNDIPIVKPETVEKMRERSDWGDYLGTERLAPETIGKEREGE